MNKCTLLLLTTLIGNSLVAGDFRSENRSETSLSFAKQSTNRTLLVNNINGSIHLETHQDDHVTLVVDKVLQAESAERLAAAEAEVYLDIQKNGAEIRLIISGPFRDPNNTWHVDMQELGYTMTYDFTIKVPAYTHVNLRTINQGEIDVGGPVGDFHVQNVNGNVRVLDAHGAGTAKTINGNVIATLAAPPQANCTFRTINGVVDVRFTGDTSADFALETMNGDMFSAFDYQLLNDAPVDVKHKDGLTRYRTDGKTRFRVGQGGPQILMSSLNGDLKIRKQ